MSSLSSFCRIWVSRSRLYWESWSVARQMFSRAACPMRPATATLSLTAAPGVRSSRGSRKAKLSPAFSVRTSLRASFSSWREKGRSRMVVNTLKAVWQKAMPTAPTT